MQDKLATEVHGAWLPGPTAGSTSTASSQQRNTESRPSHFWLTSLYHKLMDTAAIPRQLLGETGWKSPCGKGGRVPAAVPCL